MIKDSYEDERGNIYYPKFFTESYCYLRSDSHGHIRAMMCPIRDGEVIFKDAYGYKSGRHDPNLWMAQNSESMPRQFYPEAIHEKIAEAHPGHQKTAEQQAQTRAENLRRLQESRQRLLDNENTES